MFLDQLYTEDTCNPIMSPGMWPVHLERASRFTGLMTWSVDRSILGREGELDGVWADPGGAGAAGKVGGTWFLEPTWLP